MFTLVLDDSRTTSPQDTSRIYQNSQITTENKQPNGENMGKIIEWALH